jgi:thiamine kinase-like enzyme
VEAASFLDKLLAETRENKITLVHGDFSPKNVLIRQGRLILLDHETIHWGDPMFDLGFSLTHFLSKANRDPDNKAKFTWLGLTHWQTYRERVQDSFRFQDCEARAVRHTLACLLARVSGRSPLEYLNTTQQDRQRECVLRLMNKPPASIPLLIRSFIADL